MLEFKKGDVLFASNRSKKAGNHPIVYWGDTQGRLFYGLMLTHSTVYDNIQLQKEHVHVSDNSGEDYVFQYDESWIVNQVFYKFEEWGPYSKVGALTPDGIYHLEENLSDKESMAFSKYYANLIRKK